MSFVFMCPERPISRQLIIAFLEALGSLLAHALVGNRDAKNSDD